jgi:hypothetical protein
MALPITKRQFEFIVILILVLILALMIYLIWLRPESEPAEGLEKEVEQPPAAEETGELPSSSQLLPPPRLESPPPPPPAYAPKEVGASEVGEVMVEEEDTDIKKPLVTPTMPAKILNAVGTVIEVLPDKIIVQGNGSNFADALPRKLTAIYTEKTVTFTKNYLSNYKGFEGLQYLELGVEVLLDSTENIRGKTKFKVRTVNIL